MKKLFVPFLAVIAINISLCALGFSHADGENPTRIDDSPGGRIPGSAFTQGEWISQADQELKKIDAFIDSTTQAISELETRGNANYKEAVKLVREINKKSDALKDLNVGKLNGVLKMISEYQETIAKKQEKDKEIEKNKKTTIYGGGYTPEKEAAENQEALIKKLVEITEKYKWINSDATSQVLSYLVSAHFKAEDFLNVLANEKVSTEHALITQKTLSQDVAQLKADLESRHQDTEKDVLPTLAALRNKLEQYQQAKTYNQKQLDEFAKKNPEVAKVYYEGKKP